jgi:hypothetical protein
MSLSYNLVFLDFDFTEGSKLRRVLVFIHSHSTFIVLNNVKEPHDVLFSTYVKWAPPCFHISSCESSYRPFIIYRCRKPVGIFLDKGSSVSV